VSSCRRGEGSCRGGGEVDGEEGRRRGGRGGGEEAEQAAVAMWRRGSVEKARPCQVRMSCRGRGSGMAQQSARAMPEPGQISVP
jgi:hypothetical protein